MKKLSFVEKNDALVKLKSKEHFDKDCELLRKLNPTSRLHNEIANASEFSISSLSGRILMELLDLAPIEDIQSNRSSATLDYLNSLMPSGGATEEDKPAEEATEEDKPAEETTEEDKPTEEATEEDKPAEEATEEDKPAEEATEEDKPTGSKPRVSAKEATQSDKKKATRSKKITQE